MSDLPPAPKSRRLRLAFLAIGLIALGVGAWFVFGPARNNTGGGETVRPDPPPADPRDVFNTPHRNVKPDVKYVGDAACVGCHAEIAKTYREHPMGRSAEWVKPTNANFHTAGANNPFTHSSFQLRVEVKGDRVLHHVSATDLPGATTASYTVPADLSIGSGHHGRSYLTVEQGAVWQSPLSWFSQGERWDISPGYELGAANRRPVGTGCLFCHVDRVEPVPESMNRYREPLIAFQPSIGCERCHGPGELHVAERTRVLTTAKPDYTIMNPARLPHDLQGDVCRQCHLQGEARVPRRGRDFFDYRPGLPWDQFATVFVMHSDLVDSRKSVGQFEQMEQSRCYLASNGKMTCTSCHNPHAVPATKDIDSFFRDKCMNCHNSRGCKAPQPERTAKNDSCIGCHMPPRDSSNITHAAVTDHRIMRRPDAGTPKAKSLPSGQLPVVPYRAGPHAPPSEERERDWAMILCQEVGRSSRTRPSPFGVWEAAKSKMDVSLAKWPGDSVLWCAAASAHNSRGDFANATTAAKNSLILNPESEIGHLRLAEITAARDEFTQSVQHTAKLVALNPSSAEYRVMHATSLVSLKRWDEAATMCDEALRIHPLHPQARLLFAVVKHNRGDSVGGRRELDIALKLTASPQLRATMSDWFRRQTR